MSELLTVRDVATVLKCTEDAVVKRFAKHAGSHRPRKTRDPKSSAVSRPADSRRLSSNDI